MTNGLPFSILIAEDDEDDRIMIDEAFQKIGYDAEVKKVYDGDHLLQYLQQVDPSLYPSLIVLDGVLPKLNASDILSILKSNPSYKNIPVIIYTSSASPSKKQQLLSMGAYACFEKGNSMDEIVKVAKQLRDMAELKVQD